MEYQLLMGLKAAQSVEKAIHDLMERIKNPILDQPAQKWHRGDGIYRVVAPFHVFKAGDNILIKSYVHTRIVKLATPINKQEFIPYTKEFNYDTPYTPLEWVTYLRPLTIKEVWDLLPHMSRLIKSLCGYHQYMSFYPEYMCTDCFTQLGLELRQHAHVGSWCKHCKLCGKHTPVTTCRHSLKPIGR